ncbi:YhfT family protein [Paenibacillus sp. HWE-109]|uniref:YhfT family protein n=1 Tax=Paenibacillus sp. HWE-109 TaxID=1306526 RepID=UPI001EDD6307|nr:YhfT family protein [Paenibacillus sp. HWE-109]UKS24820.1 YhfT family protein [Paenibacillus sp. HWE-109]
MDKVDWSSLDFLQRLSITQMVVVICLTSLTALAAHLGKAVFHDGIRPILPEVQEGRMNRRELASIAYGLSFGFMVSVGLSFAFSFQMLNPWLLFLPTDILGVLAARWWIALGLGAVWGGIALFGLAGILSLLSMLPVDILGPLGELNAPFMVAVAAFPLLAILYQFGWRRALLSAGVVILIRQTLLLYTNSGIFVQVSVSTIVSVLFLIGFAVYKEIAARRSGRQDMSVLADEISDKAASEEQASFNQQVKRISRGLPLLMAIGCCIAIACNMGVFTGSDAAIPYLQSAWKDEGATRMGLLQSAAVVDVSRLLSFMPMVVTTALATGVYGVAGLMLVFPVGYLSPNPLIAGLLGALTIYLEILALRKVSSWLHRHPGVRETSDYFRSAMNTMMEIGLLIGGGMAVIRMGSSAPGLGLTLYILVYVANESLGRPVMRLAIGPVAAIVSGLLLNVLYAVHLL